MMNYNRRNVPCVSCQFFCDSRVHFYEVYKVQYIDNLKLDTVQKQTGALSASLTMSDVADYT